LDRIKPKLNPLKLSQNLSVGEVLNRVLRLPSVASKRYLTNKVSIEYCTVTGLVFMPPQNIFSYGIVFLCLLSGLTNEPMDFGFKTITKQLRVAILNPEAWCLI